MGRWLSDVYQIYCRLSKERLLHLSRRMSNAQSSQFLNGEDGFLDSISDLEPAEAAVEGQTGAASGANDQGEHDDGEESDKGMASSSGSGDDGDWPKAIGQAGRSGASPRSPPATIESLFELSDED